MEIKYLENLFVNSQRAFEQFKRENVLNSATLKEMFTPEYIYRGRKRNAVLVKSLKTNKPIKIYWKDTGYKNNGERLYDYFFYDKNNNFIGEKYFYLQNFPIPPSLETEMLTGYMSSDANNLYAGLGVREEELQVRRALENGINVIPRSALGPATLYHVKMGYLPRTDDLMGVNTEIDVNRHMNEIKKRSPDIKQDNFIPIIVKGGNKYYIDVNLTQTIANVKEIKDRLAAGETKKDISNLELDGVPMTLSGEQFEYWKNLIATADKS